MLRKRVSSIDKSESFTPPIPAAAPAPPFMSLFDRAERHFLCSCTSALKGTHCSLSHVCCKHLHFQQFPLSYLWGQPRGSCQEQYKWVVDQDPCQSVSRSTPLCAKLFCEVLSFSWLRFILSSPGQWFLVLKLPLAKAGQCHFAHQCKVVQGGSKSISRSGKVPGMGQQCSS